MSAVSQAIKKNPISEWWDTLQVEHALQTGNTGDVKIRST